MIKFWPKEKRYYLSVLSHEENYRRLKFHIDPSQFTHNMLGISILSGKKFNGEVRGKTFQAKPSLPASFAIQGDGVMVKHPQGTWIEIDMSMNGFFKIGFWFFTVIGLINLLIGLADKDFVMMVSGGFLIVFPYFLSILLFNVQRNFWFRFWEAELEMEETDIRPQAKK